MYTDKSFEPSPGLPVPHSPYHHGGQTLQTQAWSTGLFDRSDGCSNCCITCWCPCITFGRVAEIVDKGSPSCGTSGALYGILFAFTGYHWVYSYMYRSKLQAQYNLPRQPCRDCCVHFCCEHCAIRQLYRELSNRGFDVNIGWQGNMERQKVATATTQPPLVQGMGR